MLSAYGRLNGFVLKFYTMNFTHIFPKITKKEQIISEGTNPKENLFLAQTSGCIDLMEQLEVCEGEKRFRQKMKSSRY